MLQSLRGKDVERTSAASLYCPDAFISPLEIEDAVTRALSEDLGRAGDVHVGRNGAGRCAGARYCDRTCGRPYRRLAGC